MKSKFVLAQISNVGDTDVNLAKAKEYMAKAHQEYHPDLIVFPEVFMSHFPAGTPKDIVIAAAQPVDGPFVTALREEAKRYGMWVICGMSEAVEDPADPRKYNTTVVINSQGELVSTYRKTHLYDALVIRNPIRTNRATSFLSQLTPRLEGSASLFAMRSASQRQPAISAPRAQISSSCPPPGRKEN